MLFASRATTQMGPLRRNPGGRGSFANCAGDLPGRAASPWVLPRPSRRFVHLIPESLRRAHAGLTQRFPSALRWGGSRPRASPAARSEGDDQNATPGRRVMALLRWIVGGILFVALLFLALQNSEPAEVQFYHWFSWKAPLIFLLLTAFAA